MSQMCPDMGRRSEDAGRGPYSDRGEWDHPVGRTETTDRAGKGALQEF